MINTDSAAARFLLLQINDATFPIGSYSLSWGLETYVQQGFIHDAASTQEYLTGELNGSFIYSDLLTVRFAWEAGTDEKKLAALDELYEISRTPVELRDGSRKLARRFLKTTGSWNIQDETSSYTPVYYPVAYGSYCRKHGIEENDSLAVFLYSQTAARVTTAVKLVPLSQTDGQRLLNAMIPSFSGIVDKTRSLTERDLCRSCPGTDIRGMQHESLYTRLYIN